MSYLSVFHWTAICRRLPARTRECVVCSSDKPSTDFAELVSSACRHTQRQICNQCVRENTRTAVNELSKSVIHCPEDGCGAPLDFATIRTLVVNLNTVQGRSIAALNRFENKLSMECIEKLEDFIWCAHGCGNGAQLIAKPLPWYKCTHCKEKTCIQHGVPWHDGMTCAQYDQHLKSNEEEQQNQNFLREHTKRCPKCKVPIEKNLGCDHMTCTRCRHQFCWLCLSEFIPSQVVGLRNGPFHQPSCTYYVKPPDEAT